MSARASLPPLGPDWRVPWACGYQIVLSVSHKYSYWMFICFWKYQNSFAGDLIRYLPLDTLLIKKITKYRFSVSAQQFLFKIIDKRFFLRYSTGKKSLICSWLQFFRLPFDEWNPSILFEFSFLFISIDYRLHKTISEFRFTPGDINQISI